VDLSVPPLTCRALGAGHRQARNGRSLASCRLSAVLDLEGAARPTRSTRQFPRSPRSNRKMCRENPGWGAPRIHGELPNSASTSRKAASANTWCAAARPPSQTWRTFLENHTKQLVSIDFFTVPTIRFQVLCVFLVLAHDRRRILHFNVTAHPTAEWTGQQLREACPFDQLPRYLLRDRDAIFGNNFREQVRHMGIREVLSAPLALAASLC
jgi:hypothetical protein